MTWQESILSPGIPQLAVDGNANPSFGLGSCTHTGHHTKPWWAVDLGSPKEVAFVVGQNRDAAREFEWLGFGE